MVKIKYIKVNVKPNVFSSFMLAFLLVISCSSSDAEPVLKPSNLTVIITVVGASDTQPAGDGSGEVRVSAFAQDAVGYAYRFDNGELQETTSRTMSHTFEREGTHSYAVEVLAYSATGESISETRSVSIFKGALEEEASEEEEEGTLVFSDEFEYNGSPDSSKWHHQVIGPNNGSWYNDELQHYTDRSENSFVSNGTLKIKALKESYTSGGVSKSYTSARLNSKFAFTYGRVEVRAKLPAEAGTWPAIWTLGANINETGNYFGQQYGNVGWPACGEIDIMEQRGWDKINTIAYFHWGNTNTGAYQSEGSETAVPDSTQEFHLYVLEWDSSSMKVLVDDILVYELSNTQDKPYDNPHYLLLNIAMGGNLGGEISTDFTDATLEIDYVRVYQ
ncbi:glycoside hydrolase family 16 protein [Muriicola soli]|uniref:Glycoside hydrolase family 16 protein n=1 Tax=Muriicola soli TaxID=2507538 RepID=A0A411EBY9_9FLAO|nr:glycoside hydrolase family 16 protein [Muriicola soli]QBA64960.1 glycoside hydrolase family 16 protein [Muriicola soli]